MDRTEAAGIDPFAKLDPQLATADFALINVEMTISDRGTRSGKLFAFRAPLSAAGRIATAGIDVANLANNHARDYGPDALIDTVEWLEAAGVTTVGAGADLEAAHRYRVLTTDTGVSVAFVGASLIVPGGFAAGESRPGIASGLPPERSRVLASVSEAAAEVDVVIATVHWGIEVDTCPSTEQRAFALELLLAGADAIIGHHPHILQPVELAEGKLVAYSLGNFVWHPRSGRTGETGVLQVDFDGSEIVGWELHPHLLDASGAPAPASSGTKVDRIRDIIAGDCARHDPPPPDYSDLRPQPTEEPTTQPEETPTTLPPPTGTAGF